MPFDWLVVVNFLTNFFRFFLKFAPGPAHINIVCNVLMWNYGWIFWFLFGLVVNILCFSCDLGQIWKPGYNWFGFENLWVCKDPKGVWICHLLWLKINIVSDRKRPQESKLLGLAGSSKDCSGMFWYDLVGFGAFAIVKRVKVCCLIMFRKR